MQANHVTVGDDYGTQTVYSFLVGKYGTATLTASQVAAEYHSHPTRVRKLCQEGVIHGVKVGGGRWAIPLTEAARFLSGGDCCE